LSRPVAIILSCGKQKQSRPCAAIDMYTSGLFRLSKEAALKTGLPIYILSAEHGLISAQQIIKPYEKSAYSMGNDELIEWHKAAGQKAEALFGPSTVLVILPKEYMGFAAYFPGVVVDLCKGLPLGKRMQYLKNFRLP
jgi:hypothetical protein